MSLKFYQIKELVNWGTRKEQPEIIKQTMGGMEETVKRLEGKIGSILEHCEKKVPDMAKTLVEIAEQLASAKVVVQVDIKTSDISGNIHSKRLEMKLNGAE